MRTIPRSVQHLNYVRRAGHVIGHYSRSAQDNVPCQSSVRFEGQRKRADYSDLVRDAKRYVSQYLDFDPLDVEDARILSNPTITWTPDAVIVDSDDDRKTIRIPTTTPDETLAAILDTSVTKIRESLGWKNT